MKKKGSALILSILMLSFFMTITLTMYYIARNRNKRSIYKIKGMRISSGLDSGSAIAHYELYLADEYVSRGYPYDVTTTYGALYGVDTYPTTPPSFTTQYTTEDGITVKPIKHYTGVVLNNYNEYFGAKWDPTITGSAVAISGNAQPWIAEDKVIGSDVVSRAWMNNTGEKIVRLWTLNTTTGGIGAVSVGGYRLIESGVGATTPTAIMGNLSAVNPTNIADGVTVLVYEKILSIDKKILEVTDTETEKYKITYEEKITTSGGKIVVDELEEMTVEKLN